MKVAILILGVGVIVLITITTAMLCHINDSIADNKADIKKELSNIKACIGATQVTPIVVEDRKKAYELFAKIEVSNECLDAGYLSKEDIKHELAKRINIEDFMEIQEEYEPVRMLHRYRARLRVLK